MRTQLTWGQTFPNAARGLRRGAEISKEDLQRLETLDLGLPAIKNAGPVIASGDTDAMNELFNAQNIWAGVHVNAETAAKIVACYACGRLISGAIASLPIGVFEDGAPVRTPLPHHHLRQLLNNSPTARYSAASFWEYITVSMLFRGDAFALLRRNGNGTVAEIIPLPSQFVQIALMSEGDGADRSSYYVYYVTDGGQNVFAVHQDDMLHFPNFGANALGSAQNLRSLSVVSAAAQSMGIALAAEEFSGRFYSSGATPRYVLSSEKKLADEAVIKLRESWDRTYGTTPTNSRKPLILTEGLTATALSLSAADAQLLESRKFQITDIARAFGVPPHMIGDVEKTTSFGTGVAEQGIVFLTYTLQSHLTRFEQEINRKCFSSRTPKRQYAEFNVAGYLRSDPKAQNDAFRQAIGGSNGPGWMSINDVRQLLNMQPFEGGRYDEPYDPKNTAPDPQAAADKAAADTAAAANAKAMADLSTEVRRFAEGQTGTLNALLAKDTSISIAAPNITVEAAAIHIDPPTVTFAEGSIKVNVPEQPAPVVTVEGHNVVVQQPRETEETIERDEKNEITRITRKVKD